MRIELILGLALLGTASGGCSNHSAPPALPTPAMAPVVEDLLSLPAPVGTSKDPLPSGWEPYQFEKIPRRTAYEIVLDSGAPALRAHAESSASALRRKVGVDPVKSPLIEWSWKVERAVEKADCSRKTGDDCAARVMLLYRYDPSRASLLERAKFESMKSLHGEYPPFAMLVYAWTEDRAADDPFTSPYSDRVKVIPVRRGSAQAGKWLLEKRNHLEDFRKAFGEEPTEIDSAALMTDTDNTGSSVTAWYRSLRFASPAPSTSTSTLQADPTKSSTER